MEDLNPKEINQRWSLSKKKCFTNDIQRYEQLLGDIIPSGEYNEKILGHVNNLPIRLIYPKNFNKNLPNRLVTGCFHGDEPSGSWAILDLLESSQEILSKENISFIPIVNPTGFQKGSLKNIFGQNPNRGFKDNQPSEDGKILLEHASLLKELSSGGFLTLHEDYEQKKFYIYSFEDSSVPSTFSREMLCSVSNLYELFLSGNIDGCRAEKGIIFNNFDGSFENYLFCNGAKFSVCSETPRESGIDKRIKANIRVIKRFIELTR